MLGLEVSHIVGLKRFLRLGESHHFIPAIIAHIFQRHLLVLYFSHYLKVKHFLKLLRVESSHLL